MRSQQAYFLAAVLQLTAALPAPAQVGYSGVGQSFVVPPHAALLGSVDTGTLTGFSGGPIVPVFFLVALSGTDIVGAPLFQQALPGPVAPPSQHVVVNTRLVPGRSYAFFLGVPDGSVAATVADAIPDGRVVDCVLGYPGVGDRCDAPRSDDWDVAGLSINFVPEPRGAALLAAGLVALTLGRRRTRAAATAACLPRRWAGTVVLWSVRAAGVTPARPEGTA